MSPYYNTPYEFDLIRYVVKMSNIMTIFNKKGHPDMIYNCMTPYD